jgi:cytochrome b561
MSIDAPSWSRAQRRLHWTTAALVATGFALAWIMVGVSTDDLLLKFLLYQLHKTIGLIVLALVLLRLLLRGLRRRPAHDARIPPALQTAAAGMQVCLYGLLLAVPVLGYLVAATAPGGIPTLFLGFLRVPHIVGADPAWFAALRPAHRLAAIALVVLASGHALVALYHHGRGSPVLTRMWRRAA